RPLVVKEMPDAEAVGIAGDGLDLAADRARTNCVRRLPLVAEGKRRLHDEALRLLGEKILIIEQVSRARLRAEIAPQRQDLTDADSRVGHKLVGIHAANTPWDCKDRGDE